VSALKNFIGLVMCYTTKKTDDDISREVEFLSEQMLVSYVYLLKDPA